MAVIGILGSPRRGGNSEILLDKVLSGASDAGCETEKLILNELKIAPCQECGGCDETGICVIDDDMSKVYAALDAADGVVVASPIFFGSISAQTKMMIDRLQSLWVAQHILGKSKLKSKRPGIFIAVGGQDRKDFFENSQAIIKHFFATASFSYEAGFYFPSTNDKGEILKDQNGLERVRFAGSSLCKKPGVS